MSVRILGRMLHSANIHLFCTTNFTAIIPPRWGILPSLTRFNHNTSYINQSNYSKHTSFFDKNYTKDNCTRRHVLTTASLDAPSATTATSSFLPHLSNEYKNTPITINKGEVHIWWLKPPLEQSQPLSGIEHDDNPLLKICSSIISTHELQECTSSKDVSSKNLRIISRAFTRSVLSLYTSSNLTPGHLEFSKNENGKPDLVQHHYNYRQEDLEKEDQYQQSHKHRLRFNLTHTHGLIALAVTLDSLVGIDAESIHRRPRTDPLQFARRRFSEHEIRQLESIETQEERAAMFLRIWTLKESYVKAVGRGISAAPGLKGFGFKLIDQSLSSGSGSGSENDGLGKGQDVSHSKKKIGFWTADNNNNTDEQDRVQWKFMLLQPTEDHIVALCREQIDGHIDGAKKEDGMPLRYFASDGDQNGFIEIDDDSILLLGIGSSSPASP